MQSLGLTVHSVTNGLPCKLEAEHLELVQQGAVGCNRVGCQFLR